MHSSQLITLPTDRLLQKFGAGNHKPGSGAAAALTGLIATNLLSTVCKLTLTKQRYQRAHPVAEYVLGKVTSEHEPRLGQLFQDDSEAFDKVIHARILRDNEADTLMRKQYGQHARQLLISATEIPIKICQECLQVADYAVVMFDNGYKAVRGDSGTAAVQAVAAAKSSLGVCFLNLTSFRDGAWAARTRDFCHQLFAEVQERQSRVDRRIYGLGQEAEALLAGQLELRLEMLPSA